MPPLPSTLTPLAATPPKSKYLSANLPEIDGVPLDWIEQYFGSIGNYIASDDDDLDGLSNRDEYFAATNPTDSASILKFDNLIRSASETTLHYTNGGPESIVYIEWRRTLTDETDWSIVFTDAAPTSTTNVFTHGSTNPTGFLQAARRACRVIGCCSSSC